MCPATALASSNGGASYEADRQAAAQTPSSKPSTGGKATGSEGGARPGERYPEAEARERAERKARIARRRAAARKRRAAARKREAATRRRISGERRAERLRKLTDEREAAKRLAQKELRKQAAHDRVFPVRGNFTYGGEDARFGAPRSKHTHQGQDLVAAEGTALVATRTGVIRVVAYQAEGAGYYIVLDGDGEDREYIYMHLQKGSLLVTQGQRVRMGQQIASVGNTGRSFGAHLHFEVWENGGWYTGGKPVDPLPYLKRWDSWS